MNLSEEIAQKIAERYYICENSYNEFYTIDNPELHLAEIIQKVLRKHLGLDEETS